MKSHKIYLGIIVLLIAVAVAGFDINLDQRKENVKLKQELNSASLWVDVMDIRINELQDRSDAVQRECIDLL